MDGKVSVTIQNFDTRCLVVLKKTIGLKPRIYAVTTSPYELTFYV